MLGSWSYGPVWQCATLTLHPLAKFPGPRVAGASYIYEMWFDYVLNGKYTFEIARLHEIYDDDPNFISEVYSPTARPRNKSYHYIAGFPISIHRNRRSALVKFFSRSQVSKLQGLVHQNAQKLCDKLLADKGQAPLEVVKAFTDFTTDITTGYLFGRSTTFLDQPGWDANYYASLNHLGLLVHRLRHFVLLRHTLHLVPLWLFKMLSQDLSRIMNELMIVIPHEIDRIKSIDKAELAKESTTVLLSMIQSDLPVSEKSTKRLTAEAQTLMLAGTDITAMTLTTITYHLLDNPSVFNKLKAEISNAVPDATSLPSWEMLEQLPYLTAVILETLRHIFGAPSRLQRIATNEDIFYQGAWKPPGTSDPIEISYVIPRGYAVGMSAYIIHRNEAIFPNPSEFVPERWLDENNKRRRELDNYLLTFSKGSRQCLGMQLAYCELYICTAALVHRVLSHMQLYETTKEDIEYDHDEIIGQPRRESKGVRVRII
ncbi:trichodiene oxygenase [Xylogone sp. PMI_703]|nr:trichodiene oxygenase [Xylogone sp. PMI_703]